LLSGVSHRNNHNHAHFHIGRTLCSPCGGVRVCGSPSAQAALHKCMCVYVGAEGDDFAQFLL